MSYNLPVTLELEMPNKYGGWVVTNYKKCQTQSQVLTFIDRWKSLYALNNKCYRIHVITPSKANKMIKDIDISDII